MVHFKSFSYWYWGFLGLIVSLFYVVNCLTPYFSDDWHYCMMIGPDGKEDRWIENMRDVLVSNYYHYFQTNGRVVPHMFLMTFDALLGKGWFNVFNAVLFGAYLHLLTLNFVKERKNALMGLAISASLTLCFMCGFTNEFLWMSGVFNYEFVAVLVLLFNYLLNQEIRSKWWMPFLFLYGVVSGWTHEAVVIGLSCVYLWMCARKWQQLTLSQWVLLSGFVVGVALCVLSPGSIHRALGGDEASVAITGKMLNYVRALFYMYNLRIFFLMLLMWMLVKKMEKTWLIGALVSLLFVAFTGHDSGHSRFGVEMFSLIIVLCVFPYGKMKGWIAYAALSFATVYLLLCMPYCVQNYQEFKRVERQIMETRDGIISTNEVHPPFYAERMVRRFMFSDTTDSYFIWGLYDDWFRTSVARYYGRKDVILYFLPEKFVQWTHSGIVDDDFDINTTLPFYVCRWSAVDAPTSLTYILRKSPWASYPILGGIERFAAEKMSIDKWMTLDIEGTTYLLAKKNFMIQDRVIDIKYE